MCRDNDTIIRILLLLEKFQGGSKMEMSARRLKFEARRP